MTRMSVESHDSEGIKSHNSDERQGTGLGRGSNFEPPSRGFPPIFPSKGVRGGGGRRLPGFPQSWSSRKSIRTTLGFSAQPPRSPLARRGGRQPCCSARGQAALLLGVSLRRVGGGRGGLAASRAAQPARRAHEHQTRSRVRIFRNIVCAEHIRCRPRAEPPDACAGVFRPSGAAGCVLRAVHGCRIPCWHRDGACRSPSRPTSR